MTYEKVLCGVDKLRNLKQWVNYLLKTADKGELKQNKSLKGILNGKRCFILGNGPSLKEQNLIGLKNEFVITVNNAGKNSFFNDINSNIHIWEDHAFFALSDSKEEILKRFTNVNTEFNKPITFIPLREKEFVDKYKLYEKIDIRFYNPIYIFHSDYNVNIDYTKGVPGFFTVVGEAIVLAIYLGAKEIYLLGCDCTSILTKLSTIMSEVEPQYSFEMGYKERKYFDDMKLKDAFYTQYQVISQYEMLNKYCKKNNVELINSTHGGVLDNIKRIPLEELF